MILFIIELFLLAVVLCVLYLYTRLDLISTEKLDTSKIGTADLDEETEEKLEGYTTIALFGLDNRTEGTYDSGNSDVIMIMNIDHDTGEIKLVSVYRDTYLNIAASGDSASFRKCNAAYSYGGAEQAITMLNQNLDLDIDNYVSFDFYSVADAIDILGGVEITIESSAELKYLNQYIEHTNKILGTDSDTIDSVGTYILDGTQAVAYARIRYTSGGDYKRTERQRIVLNQMIEEAKSASASELLELINTILPEVSTDLTKAEIVSLATAALSYDFSSSSGFPYYKTTTTLGSKGSVVVPLDLTTNVSMLHEALFGTEDYEPSETVQAYSQQIVNDTGYDADDAQADDYTDDDDFIESDDEETEDEDGSADASEEDDA